MKRICFVSFGIALMLVVVTVFAADQKQTGSTNDKAQVQELAKQVDSMQAKIKELEQRLVKLEKEKEKAIVSVMPPATTPTIVVPRLLQQRDFLGSNFADPSNPPKIWGEDECNGWKYYMIPLSATGQGAATEIPLATAPLAAR
jgi:hypothetical protein